MTLYSVFGTSRAFSSPVPPLCNLFRLDLNLFGNGSNHLIWLPLEATSFLGKWGERPREAG